ncbi:F(420)H(2) dehydrogenase subunit L [uncultured archaeon]|nr:F(420)H(2) dehydrogenase subunit L [uncultured archaeon]
MVLLITAVFLILLLSIVIPLIGLKLKHSSLRKISLILIMLACLISIFLSLQVLLGKDISFQIFVSGTAFSMLIDSLAAFFIIIISIVGFCVSIYSISYAEHFESVKKRNFLVSLMALFILSMMFVVISHNLLGFLFFWELMSISSFLLVLFDYEKEETKKAGIFYFVMTQLGTIFLIFSFILIYINTGTLDFTNTSLSPFLSSILFITLAIGFGTKAGMVPFHKWLSYAHPASPSSISALMSGVMIKVAIYGLIRFLFIISQQQLWWGIAILIFGTISALLGIIYALKEQDLKRLLAYSSIENIGIILISIGLYMIFTYYSLPAIALVALFAGLFHAFNHSLFKSLLFMTAGSVVNATHTKNIEKMGGLVKNMKYTSLLFLIGAISISALPPFNGFVSELMIFQVFFKSNSISSPLIKLILMISMSLFALTSALAAACFVKAFGIVFLAVPRSKEAKEAKEADKFMLVGPAILAILCMVIGVFSFQILNFIGEKAGVSFDLPNLLWISIGTFIIGVIAYLIIRNIGNKHSRVSETWGCGINSQNSKMEYTASGFSEPIVTIFSSIYQPKKINKPTFYDSKGVIFKEGQASLSLIKFFEEYLYLPPLKMVHYISEKLYKIQNKIDLDSFILYIFLTILALLIIVGVVIR